MAERTCRRLAFPSTDSASDVDDAPPPSPPPADRRRPPPARIFAVRHCGVAQTDGRVGRAALAWAVAEVRELGGGETQRAVLRVAADGLRVVGVGDRILLDDDVASVVRYCRCRQEPACFAVVLRDAAAAGGDWRACHVFLADGQTKAIDVFNAIRTVRSEARFSDQLEQDGDVFAPSGDPHLPLDAISSYSNYEVYYVGRLELSDKRPPRTLIDEAVSQFVGHNTDVLRCVVEPPSAGMLACAHTYAKRSRRQTADGAVQLDSSLLEAGSVDADSAHCSLLDSAFHDSSTADSLPSISEDTTERRVMLLLIGGADFRLISLNEKKTLLVRRIKDVSRVIQGVDSPNHVGIICTATSALASSDFHYVCYVVRCRDAETADSVGQASAAAFRAAAQSELGMAPSAASRHSCPFCPLEQFSRLCDDVDGLSPLNVHETVLQRVGQLNSDLQEKILTEYKKLCCRNRTNLTDIPEDASSTVQVHSLILVRACQANAFSVSNAGLHRRNVILLSLLRNLCEAEQRVHEHCPSNAAINLTVQRRRSASGEGITRLLELGGRAKRSFSVSIDTLGRRLSRGEEAAGALMDQWTNRRPSFSGLADGSPMRKTSSSGSSVGDGGSTQLLASEQSDCRPRSRTLGSDGAHRQDSPRHPRLNILTKLSDAPMSSRRCSSPRAHSTMSTPPRKVSMRQAIFSRVVYSPQMPPHRSSIASFGDGSRHGSVDSGTDAASEQSERALRTPAEFRALWKKAIMRQILENRISRRKLPPAPDKKVVERIKLNYEEITPCSEDEVRPLWARMLADGPHRFDRLQIECAMKAGVPRDLRSSVWRFLIAQNKMDRGKSAPVEPPPPYVYSELLNNLTSYQHAILIDLGRTFPSHPYFAQQLGPGQLSLFNILKAYSLYDQEVGYCQGLSFVAGALLLHMDEEKAFDMLVYLMFVLGLRKQYRPDMMALQVKLYQLSRLLHDRIRELHVHLENYEIPPLYAAPWFLTLFASSFPLGFVARVFDLIFLCGDLEVVYKVSLVLLEEHKELITHCISFESINECLKTTLPEMGVIQMERIFNSVLQLDVGRELLAYEVEYHVLQEEMLASPASVGQRASTPDDAATAERLSRLHDANRSLKLQNMELLEKLQQAHQRCDMGERVRGEMACKLDSANATIADYQAKLAALQTRLSAVELERKALGHSRRNGTLPTDADDSGLFATPQSPARRF